MDTKSKSSKKFSFIAAGIMVGLAILIFMGSYPVYKNTVNSYVSRDVKNNQLLEQIYKSTHVLYKDILDRTEKKNHSYYEMYMTVEEAFLSGDKEYEVYFEEDFGSEELKVRLEQSMNSVMESWRDEMLDKLAKGMDYLVVDDLSGEMIKNTSREIERLLDGQQGNWEDPYVYYVKMSYDNAGNIYGLSVRGDDPDMLLKNAHSTMAGEGLLRSINNEIASYGYYRNEFYLYDNKDRPKKISFSVDENPRNVTFVFALTALQNESISRPGGFNFVMGDGWSERRAYFEAGAGDIYLILLIVLGVCGLFITRSKKYCLHHLQGFRMHLEVSFCGLCFLAGFSTVAVMMMQYTNNGGFESFLSGYADFLPSFVYPVLVGAVNIAVLGLLFGGWFYFITSYGELFDLGPVRFVKERSLIVQGISWVLRTLKNKKDEFREEMLRTDLEENTNKVLIKVLLINYAVIALISFTWIFGWVLLIIYTFVLYICIKRYIRNIREQYEKLLDAADSIAEGNLATVFGENWGMFESCKDKLSKIQEGLQKAVREEVKSQRMKTELITNVSHDLKTPLTAITTYIELLEAENISEEERKEYLKVLKKKSERLKFLIEDLFEVSKANTGDVKLNLVEMDICSLLRQVYLEYEDRVEEADLIFRFHMPEEKIILCLDSQKTYRIFENLYTNIIKYAMPHSRVYVDVRKTEKGIQIEMKNMAACELNIPPEELTERFVRGDSSRNTEGSGLGLAIARSFTELQGGTLKVDIDGDLFKVTIIW